MAKGSSPRPKAAKTKSVARKSSAKAHQKEPAKRDEKIKKESSSNQLPSSFSLTWQTFLVFKNFWRTLGGIMLVYLILNVVLAGGLVSSIHSGVNDIQDKIHSGNSRLSEATNGFASLVTGSNTGSETSTMQSVLIVLGSLVIIWTLRQLFVGEKVSVKQSYYRSMAPLIPFVLVLLVVILQLLPLTAALFLLSVVLAGLVSSTPLLVVVLSLLFAALASWSIYMLSSSIFALYIVTLPDVEPLQALRSAKSLVRRQRWQLMRKILFLPFFIMVFMALVIIPLILVATALVTPVLFLLTLLILPFTHAYFYSLYRRLLA